eukprot:10395574-Alexandrium_andersonii.AAC.1
MKHRRTHHVERLRGEPRSALPTKPPSRTLPRLFSRGRRGALGAGGSQALSATELRSADEPWALSAQQSHPA